MPQNFKGFTLNKVGEKPKWSAREIQIFKDLITLLVPDKNTPLTDTHHHSNLYRSDDSAVALNVNDTGRVNIAADSGTLPALSSDTFFVVNNNSAAGDNVGMSLIAGTAGNAVINFGDSGDENIGFFDYDNNNNSFSIGTSATKRMGIDSQGIVGIGSSASAGLGTHGLHIVGDNGTIPTLNASTFLLINNNSATGDNAIMSIISGTAGNSIINFGDSGDENIGFFDYDNNNNSLSVGVAGFEALHINSSRNVGIGVVPSHRLDVAADNSGNAIAARFTGVGDTTVSLKLTDDVASAFFGATNGFAYFGTIQGINTNNARIDSNGLFGLGVLAPAARAHFLSTTEQLRLGFDATNFVQHTVDSTGELRLIFNGASGDGELTLETSQETLGFPRLTLHGNNSGGGSGSVNFDGESSTSVQRTFGQIRSEVDIRTNGSEDGSLFFSVINAGALVDSIEITDNKFVFRTPGVLTHEYVKNAQATGINQNIDFFSGVLKIFQIQTLVDDLTGSSEDSSVLFRALDGGALNAVIHIKERNVLIGGTATPSAKLDVAGEIAILDGMTAPSATVGRAKLYVDTADGDLKVIFGDGTIKTIVVDT